MKKLCRLSFLSAFFSATFFPGPAPAASGKLEAATSPPFSEQSFDRSRLPEALRNVPLDRLSSGALLRLDRDGDLVESSEAWNARVKSLRAAHAAAAAPLVALDPRVAANIRLGDDPLALPANMRAQAEPHIARAPASPDFLVATFQEGRFTTGGAVNCGYSVSLDGGLTWTRALIPNLATSSGGSFDRATDPVAAIDLNGAAYLNTLGLRDGPLSDGTVLVSRSTNRGITWSAPFVAYQPPNTNSFPDKNWFTVNNFAGTATAGRIVVTFTLFSNTGGLAHPIMRVFSDNGGANWSPASLVHAANLQVQGSQPVFLPDGKLAIPYWNFNGTANFADDFLQLVVSNDGGGSFGAPRFITNVAIYDQPSIRDGAFLPSATTDSAGNIHLVYQAIHNGAPRILFTKSANAGVNWTVPVPISNNPAGAGVFNPAVASSPDGQTLTVVFYDGRDNPGSTTLVDTYLAQSFNGGATWQPNIRLTSVSTDAALAPLTAGGYMLGDYLGIAAATSPNVPAVPVWVDTRTGNPDPFIARVGIAPQFDFTSWQAARLSLAQINNPQTGGPAGDADGDGDDNLSEFQNGTDPNDPGPVVHTARQTNISTRARVAGGDNVLIGGFIVTGTVPKRVLVRGLGPSLAAFNVTGPLQDPTLQLVPQSGPSITNDDWQDSDPAAILATQMAPSDPREAAIVATLPPGSYTALLRSKNDVPGVGLVEFYDLNATADSEFENLSSRGRVGNGDDVLIGGVIVGPGTAGTGSARTVIRGLGPSLTPFGVAGALQNPELLIFNSNGDLIGFNANWQDSSQGTELQTLNLAPGDPREAAIVLTLASGSYTAIVRGKDGGTGVSLVESYNIP